MGLFGPSRKEREERARVRHHQLAYTFSSYGFAYEPDGGEILRGLLPFAVHTTPDRYGPRAHGTLGDARIEVFEYSYDSTDAEGNKSTYTRVLCVVQHPAVEGSASITPDAAQWGGIAAFLDALFWIPPFIFLKLIGAFNAARNPDRTVGDREFDRLYYVRAESDEAAQRAIPPALRQWLVRHGFRGSLELRPGMILYSAEGARLSPEAVPVLLSYARPLLDAAMPPLRRHPMR